MNFLGGSHSELLNHMDVVTKINKYLTVAQNYISSCPVQIISEDPGWSIYEDALNIQANLSKFSAHITFAPIGIRHKVIHFASFNTFFKKDKIATFDPSNKLIVTWFHVDESDPRLYLVQNGDKYIHAWHTSCSITKNKMISLGIKAEKIKVIPLGICLKDFSPLSSESEKMTLRQHLGIPNDRNVIGSFQKDGVGWGEGSQPKLIKGPDIFCNIVTKLSKQTHIHVVLAGPARGYVINRLKAENIPFTHVYVNSPKDLKSYYQCLDTYLITSRAEGGPKAILESLACGIPLITTNVGMAADYLSDGQNALIVEQENVDKLTQAALRLFADTALQKRLIKNGLETIQKFDWKAIGRRYETELYSPWVRTDT